MKLQRVFMDTVFIEALLNRRDRYHAQAVPLWPAVRSAREVWLTEAILTEVGNAMSAIDRSKAARFIRQCYRAGNMHVVPVGEGLFARGLALYESRPDKEWGLTDCISFIVMEDQALTDVLTADRHFLQAGYRGLLT